ncbi:MAG: ATP-binding protein [Bdellovibrionales bacterium]
MSTAAKMMRDHESFIPKNGPVPNRRILVVDDEPAIGDGIRRILCPPTPAGVTPIRSSRALTGTAAQAATSGAAPAVSPTTGPEFDVVVVTTPQEAITAVTDALRDQRPFAMGFFDVMLGADMDGIELVKQILSVDPKMFAVFVTAYQDRSVDNIGQYIGVENREKWDYINKPFSDGEILQKARNATSLWDLHRLKEWQEERLSEAHGLLLQNERQNAVAAVGRSVAHEFGNLLTHIVGNAELALEQNKPEQMKGALELILKASDTATNILKRFRNLHGSEEKLAPASTVDLWQTLEEALELMEFQFRKKYIMVKKTKRDYVPIVGHRHSLVQVFVNLFINAMHAVPATGGEIKIQINTQGDKAEVSIHDSGPGIPEDILGRVTEPLFTTKGSEGSGLGLAIVKEIIEIEHSGQLKVQNHPRGGAQILITLPIAVAKGKGKVG